MNQFTKAQIETIQSSLDSISEREIEEQFCEMLDEQGPCTIAGYEYDQSHALRLVDPTAYRCGLADYISSCLDDQYFEIDGEYFRQDEVNELIESLLEVNS